MSWEDILKKPFDATARRERQQAKTERVFSNNKIKNEFTGSKTQAIRTYLDPYMNIALIGEKAKYTEKQKKRREEYIQGKKDFSPYEKGEMFYPRTKTRQGNTRGMKYPSKSLSRDFELRITGADMEKFPEKVQSIIFNIEDEELEKLYKITIVGRQETKYNKNGLEFQFILNN